MYERYHLPRYEALFKIICGLDRPQLSVLDIGVSYQTEMLRAALTDPSRIDTLGFEPDHERATGRNYRFNLNDSQSVDTWRADMPEYDLIVMAEVIEHLYTAPGLVLAFLRSLTKPGGTLIVTTPNAVALHKRLKLLFGRHPYQMIAVEREYPAHFREYTKDELIRSAISVHWEVVHHEFQQAFDYRYVGTGVDMSTKVKLVGPVANLAYKLCPPQMRPGQAIVLRRPF
jgi:SAM-dependent methyltransferase